MVIEISCIDCRRASGSTPLSIICFKEGARYHILISSLKAYGWEDINLAHDFYEVDYLPENDRVRYTISPDTRKKVLKRLLKLNHEIHEQKVKASLHVKGKTKKQTKSRYTRTDKAILKKHIKSGIGCHKAMVTQFKEPN